MNDEGSKLTQEDLIRAVELLRQAGEKFNSLYWVDNANFYRSELAKQMGFECSDFELAAAQTHPQGLIKISRGVELYLTKYIKFKASD